MGGSTAVTWKGVKLDPRSRDMMESVEAGVGFETTPVQGSYSNAAASAGTHSGGGAIDLRVRDWSKTKITNLLVAMRERGWAAWHRTEAQGFDMDHIHGIAIACPELSRGAQAQVVAYQKGRDGLARNGPDDGPYVPFTTWEQYQAKEEDDMALTTGEIEKIADRVLKTILQSDEMLEMIQRGATEAPMGPGKPSFGTAVLSRLDKILENTDEEG